MRYSSFAEESSEFVEIHDEIIFPGEAADQGGPRPDRSKILSILRDEGRLAINELADRVGLSSSPCWSRVRHLEEIGVIKHYAAVIDHVAIGLKDIVFIEVTLDKHDDKVLARFGDALAGCRKLSRPISSPANTIIWSR